MLDDRERLSRQKSDPAIIRLHRALSRLQSVVTVMHSGAHPDDEQSGMVAYLRFGRGMRVVITCSTRGEGGQNILGAERQGALGALRTREMEQAARELDCDIHWVGHGPEDRIHDFGFSKNGEETLDRWGEYLLIDRMVRAYRREKPDIVIPTFLDVPGQHGHHRAMTLAAERAIALAADPIYDCGGLAPWKVAKFYLPAWSGASDAYDDEIAPPPVTVSINAPRDDAITGVSYDEIGQWSRAFHHSQGMGQWLYCPKSQWDLHLSTGEKETDINDHLPATLADIAALETCPNEIQALLVSVQTAINRAIAAFPDRDAIKPFLLRAYGGLTKVLAILPVDFAASHGHRLTRKKQEIAIALFETLHFKLDSSIDNPFLFPGGNTKIDIRFSSSSNLKNIQISLVTTGGITSKLQDEKPGHLQFSVSTNAETPVGSVYPRLFHAGQGNGPVYVQISATCDGQVIERQLDLPETVQVVPAYEGCWSEDAIIAPLGKPARRWTMVLDHNVPAAELAFKTPEGWQAKAVNHGKIDIIAPADLKAGLYDILPVRDDLPLVTKSVIDYPHVSKLVYHRRQPLRILALDLELPENVCIGYVGGGADNVGNWMRRMGLDVTDLGREDLAGDLSKFDTLVIGIFAFGMRSDLRDSHAQLHDYVRKGGHLLTLYHRPKDNWDENHTPPAMLKIGAPSLRWRVTDPNAPVRMLLPHHPLFNGPNKIGVDDWKGWDKERGLYFAASWDDAYQPLIAVSDSGEKPLTGGLVSAEIGAGRHTHTSLVLHHQLDKCVPGAFRLLANLVQGQRHINKAC
ncbi:PIG-L family deacetylase [Thalassospira marina]|uniref:PIG-L domain-containing protein n=1 Tax=Thalassospira marina TaxID=2048283 RepID=A0ABM6QFM7_9PROT|nr:PIG-L family deacetylase [Thalassospira marina]AUG55388.1 PIG-L domain-containing protein [Thalassospira marina]